MLLSGEQIKRKQLIQKDRAESYRAASYDLTVGSIIPPIVRSSTEGSTPTINVVESFVIPPQGMVEVISQERVKLPETVAGYATVKTGLCDKGILALNIGIIDPRYEGLVSSTLINFGKSEFNLKKGEVFLRLTFFEYTPSETVNAPNPKTDDQYVRDKESKVLQHLSRTFLNLHEAIKELTAPILHEWTSGILRYVVIGSLIVAGSAFLVTLGSSFAARWLSPRELNTAEMTVLMRQLHDSTNKRIDQMEGELRLLKDARTQASPRPQKREGPAPKPAARDTGP